MVKRVKKLDGDVTVKAGEEEVDLRLGLVTVRLQGDIVADVSSEGFVSHSSSTPPPNAIPWGAKIRVDANMVGIGEKGHLDDDGQPAIRWHYDWSSGMYHGSWVDDPSEEAEAPLIAEHWQGERRAEDSPVELIPQGVKQFYEHQGLTTIFRADKSREDADRHVLVLWYTIDGVEEGGEPVKSNYLVFVVS